MTVAIDKAEAWMFLFDPTHNKAAYVIKTTLLVLAISLPMSYLVSWLLPDASVPEFGSTTLDLVLVILVAPLLETLLMVPIFWVLAKFTQRLDVTCLLSGLIWAMVHAASHPAHGLVIFSSFVLFSLAYKVWEKASRDLAVVITFSVHALNNAILMALMLILRE